jgi:hypothetical protein
MRVPGGATNTGTDTGVCASLVVAAGVLLVVVVVVGVAVVAVIGVMAVASGLIELAKNGANINFEY